MDIVLLELKLFGILSSMQLHSETFDLGFVATLLCFVMSFDIILERCCERMDFPVAHVVHVLQFL